MATNTISALQIPPLCRKYIDYPLSHPWNLKPNKLVVSSIIGSKLSLRPTNPFRGVSEHRPSAVANVLLSPPNEKPERAFSEKLLEWSARAIRSISLGALEAYKLRYPKTGTECLLMGILVEGTSLAANFLRADGITYYKVREETVNLLGTSVYGCRHRVRSPFTEPAQRAINWAIDAKRKSGESGEITTTHLLLGIWSEKDYAGHKILETFGFDDEKAKELAKSMNVE